MARQRLARKADRARVDRVGRPAVVAAGDGVSEPAGLAERTDEHTAGVVDGAALARMGMAEGAGGPRVELLRERAMARLEERPVEVSGSAGGGAIGSGHHHFGAMRSPGRIS